IDLTNVDRFGRHPSRYPIIAEGVESTTRPSASPSGRISHQGGASTTMDATTKDQVPATVGPTPSTSMQKYLDRAVKVLGQFKGSQEDTNSELVRLLDDVKHLDEPKVLAISRTISYMSRFNQLVRDNVEDINVGNRYLEISQMFDSIREDSKTLINQLQDG